MEKRKLWHVMNRGVRKSPIFLDDRQRLKFLEFLEKGMVKYEIEMAAFSLMDNHYHLEPLADREALSSLLRYVNSRYARRFNREAELSGHLFEGRTRAYPARWIGWEGKVSRYIHMNPVKGGLALKPEDYRWSSMGHYQGRAQNPLPINTSLVQQGLGEGDVGVQRYLACMREEVKRFREEGGEKQLNLLVPENIDISFESNLIKSFKENLSEEVKKQFSIIPSQREFRLLATGILLDSGMVSRKMLSVSLGISERTLRGYRQEARDMKIQSRPFGDTYDHFMDELEVIGWPAFRKMTA